MTNSIGETARDVAKRYAKIACVKLLEEEAGKLVLFFPYWDSEPCEIGSKHNWKQIIYMIETDDEKAYEKSDLNSHTESKDPINLSSQQKHEARCRAKKRLEESEKQFNIARSNYIQLGGKMNDTLNDELREEYLIIK